MPKTQLTPKQLFEKRNTTDVFNRNVIMGLLRILNQKLVYQQIWNDEEDGIENVTVPFFFDFGGTNANSERFIQDNYTFFTSDECTNIGIKKIDGNFDILPQGRISMSSVSIDSGNITNRFAQGIHTKYEDGVPKSYISYLYSIPLIFQFNLEIRTDTMNTAFKIDQAVREFFYKNKTFRFNYKGTVVPCRAGFPETGYTPAGTQYKMGEAPSEQYIKLSFTIQCETYQPVFDQHTEMPMDNYIKDASFNIWVNNQPEPQHRTGPIFWRTDMSTLHNLVSGQDILFEWNWNYQDRDLLFVDICYKVEGDDRLYMIDSCDNHGFYCWKIPYDFTDNERIDIMVPNTDEMTVATQPEIFIYPDFETGTVEPGNVYVKNKGFFRTPYPEYDVDAIISYMTRKGEIREYPARIHTRNYMMDAETGIEFGCFVYENDIQPRRIKIVVQDHNEKDNFVETDWISVI